MLLSDRTRIKPLAVWVALGVMVAYSWWAAGVRPFTSTADVAVAVPGGLITLAAGWQLLRSRQAVPGRGRVQWRPWAALVLALFVLEMFEYLESPRSSHPTMSSIADDIMGTHAGRAAMFVGWLLMGGWLLRRLAGRARTVFGNRGPG